MNQNTKTPVGVIEGFFGRTWSWEQRARLADFLSARGLDFYLYAPKADRHLRSGWQSHWPEPEWRALNELREHYRSAGVDFGLGLSPLELCQASGRADVSALDRKIDQIERLQPDLLGLLFDDMRGDLPDLARTQAALANRAAERTGARRVILCPTYYSLDPVLDKVFGQRPAHYLRELGDALDSNIDVFWTGPEVCSERYDSAHLEVVANELGRRPFLWDNYPVNDGAVKSRHLYLHPVGSDRTDNRQLVAGHAANPMNQFALSLPALASLPRAYSQAPYDPDRLLEPLLNELYPADLARLLARDANHFARQGLDALAVQERRALEREYRQIGHEAATEVADWLAGHYTFDPACLTE